MKTLRGKSGVLHTFHEVSLDAGVEDVVDNREVEADEFDVIRLYAKMIDVGAKSGELVAASFSSRARELADLYGMKLKTGQGVVITEP